MPALTRDQASLRTDCYLHHAATIFREHDFTVAQFGEQASYSALQVSLKAVLGRELTSLLVRAGEPIQQHLYPNGNGDKDVEDHVIPLGEIIAHLKDTPAVWRDLTAFRAFMVRNIVIARIPKSLDDALTARGLGSTMPSPLWKRTDLAEHAWLDSVWSRYAAIGVPRPGLAGTRFTNSARETRARRPAKAQ